MSNVWFAPINWQQGGLQVAVNADNRMTVTGTGNVEARAMNDGLLVYSPATGTLGVGNVELALFPDKWSDTIKQMFGNSSWSNMKTWTTWTESPPGRVVYFNVSQSIVKAALHDLIMTSFTTYLASNTIARCLYYTPKIPGKLSAMMLLQLSLAWKNGTSLDDVINPALDIWLASSATDTLQGLPVAATNSLFTLNNTSLDVEIRNFYGEPLHPQYYLRRLGQKPTDLAPTPPFPTNDVPPRSEASTPTLIRIPKNGSVEFGTYQSNRIWSYSNYNPANQSFTINVKIRSSGAAVPMPDDPGGRNLQQEATSTWNAFYTAINTFAAIFRVPCELIVATIIVESRKDPTTSVPLKHSIHLEPLSSGPYPQDYLDLVYYIETTPNYNGSLDRAAINAFWKAVGGWGVKGGAGHSPPVENKQTVKQVALSYPHAPTDPVLRYVKNKAGSSIQINWTQLAEIVTVKTEQVTGDEIIMPALSKKKDGTRYYDLLKNGTSEVVANMYWQGAGGVRVDPSGNEDGRAATNLKLTPPVPYDPNANITDMVDPDTLQRVLTWGELLQVLAVLAQSGLAKVPIVTYSLKTLASAANNGTYNYQQILLSEQLPARIGGGDATDIVNRYIDLGGKDVVFVEAADGGVGPNNEAGVEAFANPQPQTQYLTLGELKAISHILPARISIGIGQALFDTIMRKIVPWIENCYGSDFFSKNFLIPDPPALTAADDFIDWMWDNVWSRTDIQTALIAGYLKALSLFEWQAHRAGKVAYRVGDVLTRFDFPRVGAAYNHGIVAMPPTTNDDADWGLWTAGGYFRVMWPALSKTVDLFSAIPAADPTQPLVRLRPDLEDKTGMDPR